MNEKKIKNNSHNTPIEKLVHFKWGGTTSQWEEEATQIMNYLQDQLDEKETKEEKERKIQYGNKKQRW
ncbi:hypothetical protein FQB35_08115 [Crassaminicella thermophila]|uniref:Uncharacterized protein n=1 Tax=Crassaminicella thermophila TaxID=2599308 RepID=A0A5C0SEH8_CRATE|nr:hypothetical protein [Crassaminicella thermophila]QEK12342.1 hypothetical protein FQB35_08115 [Crassaminicella thermophila]